MLRVKKIEQKTISCLPATSGRTGLVGMLSLGEISHKVSKELSGECHAQFPRTIADRGA
jgi:hypothetical protein